MSIQQIGEEKLRRVPSAASNDNRESELTQVVLHSAAP